ncbi:hypothetical protein AGMMS49936_03550 [Endomicrobiia bacterium]|nr:hypothetical protein AGMMS49936_03550 [Endomicrobiia bacterium]
MPTLKTTKTTKTPPPSSTVSYGTDFRTATDIFAKCPDTAITKQQFEDEYKKAFDAFAKKSKT